MTDLSKFRVTCEPVCPYPNSHNQAEWETCCGLAYRTIWERHIVQVMQFDGFKVTTVLTVETHFSGTTYSYGTHQGKPTIALLGLLQITLGDLQSGKIVQRIKLGYETRPPSDVFALITHSYVVFPSELVHGLRVWSPEGIRTVELDEDSPKKMSVSAIAPDTVLVTKCGTFHVWKVNLATGHVDHVNLVNLYVDKLLPCKVSSLFQGGHHYLLLTQPNGDVTLYYRGKIRSPSGGIGGATSPAQHPIPLSIANRCVITYLNEGKLHLWDVTDNRLVTLGKFPGTILPLQLLLIRGDLHLVKPGTINKICFSYGKRSPRTDVKPTFRRQRDPSAMQEALIQLIGAPSFSSPDALPTLETESAANGTTGEGNEHR